MPDGLTQYTVTADDAIAFICDSPTGYAEVSPDGRFRWINQAYANVLNAHKEQVLGKDWGHWTHPEDILLESELSQQVAAGKLPQYRLVKRYRQLGHTDRMPRIVWGELTVFGKFDLNGMFVGYRVTFVPYIHNEPSSADGVEWKKWLHVSLTFLVQNWKTVFAIVLTLAGLTRMNFGGLQQQLQDMQKLKAELDELSQFSSSSPSPVLPGPSSPNTDSGN